MRDGKPAGCGAESAERPDERRARSGRDKAPCTHRTGRSPRDWPASGDQAGKIATCTTDLGTPGIRIRCRK